MMDMALISMPCKCEVESRNLTVIKTSNSYGNSLIEREENITLLVIV